MESLVCAEDRLTKIMILQTQGEHMEKRTFSPGDSMYFLIAVSIYIGNLVALPRLDMLWQKMKEKKKDGFLCNFAFQSQHGIRFLG